MIANLLRKFQHIFHSVISFNTAKDKLLLIDFTATNKTLTPEIFDDTEKFSVYINTQLQNANALYGIGGYNENRSIYSRSKHLILYLIQNREEYILA